MFQSNTEHLHHGCWPKRYFPIFPGFPGPKKIFSRILFAACRSKIHSKKLDFGVRLLKAYTIVMIRAMVSQFQVYWLKK